MKIPFFRTLATVAVIATAAPALRAQEAEAETPPVGVSDGQAVELARIVNAAEPDDVKDAISTVVKDVMASADDANLAAGQISAALAAAVVARQGPNTPELLAAIVAAVSASGSGDSASALAERAAASIVAATGTKAFVEFLPESIASAASDAADDPLSVLTAKDANAVKALYAKVLEILTPDRYAVGTDNDAVFVRDTTSATGRALADAEAAAAAAAEAAARARERDRLRGRTSGGDSDGGEPPHRPGGSRPPRPRPSPTPVGRR